MVRLRTVLPLASVAALAALAACSSSSPASSTGPAPEWIDPPAGEIDVHEGRVTELTLRVRVRDPESVAVEPSSTGGLAIEVIRSEEPATDGLFHARLLLRAGYGLVDPTARVDIVEAGTRASFDLALRPHRLSWRSSTWEPSSGPPAREHGVFIVDREAHAAFLLQGSGYRPQWVPIGDAWRLDLATNAWSPWTPTGDVPPATAGMRVAHVPGTKTAYVHGGYTGSGSTEVTQGELYRVDLDRPDHTFTKLTSDGDGKARYLHAIAYDAKGEQLVVFGGVRQTPRMMFFDDTWLVKIAGDRATWTKLETTTGPSARYGAFYAFDEPSRRFVVWSGGQLPKSAEDPVNPAKDAWALDLSVDPPAWSKLAPAGEAPPPRRNGCVMHDPVGRRLFVYGGTPDARTDAEGLWVLSLEPGHEEWTKLDLPNAPPLRSSGFGFATPDGGVTCSFGNSAALYTDVNALGYFD